MNTIPCNFQKSHCESKKNFLVDPFASLYQTSENKKLNNESIENLIHYAWSLEECIPGDFDLKTLVTEIKDQIFSFVRTGLLAYKVKILKLYRKGHKSFKTFCEKALGVSHWQINRKIEAARVVMELAQAGFSVLPTCEAQARPLTKLYGVELCDQWQKVVDSLKPHTITSNQINEVLGVETKTASLRLPKKLYEQIRKKALEMGLSIEQLLNTVFEDDEEVDVVEEEILSRWEEDLKTFDLQETTCTQSDKNTVPIGTVFEANENFSSTTHAQETSKEIIAKTKATKDIDSNYLDSTPVLSQDNCTSTTQVKKSKSKKPLLEVLNLDKKNKLKAKRVKKHNVRIDQTLNDILSDINKSDIDKSD